MSSEEQRREREQRREERREAKAVERAERRADWRGRERGGLVFGLILISVGVILLLDNLFPGLGFGNLWPIIIIAWGFATFVTGFIPPIDISRILNGVFLGTVGVILLYNTLGIIPFSFWFDVFALWPVLLIAAGIAILGGVTRSKVLQALPGVIIVGTLILALVYQGSLFQNRNITQSSLSRDMVAGINTGSAEIDFTVGNLTMGATDKLYDIRARNVSQPVAPIVSSESSGSNVELVVRSRNNFPVFLGNRQGRGWNVLLSRDVTWDIDVKPGVSDSNLDLRDLRVRRFNLDGGISSTTIRFGNGVNRTDADINAGISSQKAFVPKSMGVRLTYEGGLSSRNFRDIDLRRINEGGTAVYETPNFDRAAKKLYIHVNAGISSFTVQGY